MAAIPVTVITGFLGSGKTTLVNRLLRDPALADTAVIVNELGEVGIDHLLVEALDEDVVLLNAGCLCCALREDLVACLGSLLARRSSGTVPPFRRVVIETTGLADPAPILHTLIGHEELREAIAVDGIVATVDALHGGRQLDEHSEALKQAAVADRIVLTKTDLAGVEAGTTLERRLAAINPGAVIVEAVLGDVTPSTLLDAGPFERGGPADLARWLGEAPADDGDGHRHDDRIATICLGADTPIRIERFVAWVERLLARHGEKVLRLKGVLDVAGSEAPIAVHGVQHVFHPLQRLAAWPAGPRASRIVVIARALPGEAVERSFRAVVEGRDDRPSSATT